MISQYNFLYFGAKVVGTVKVVWHTAEIRRLPASNGNPPGLLIMMYTLFFNNAIHLSYLVDCTTCCNLILIPLSAWWLLSRFPWHHCLTDWGKVFILLLNRFFILFFPEGLVPALFQRLSTVLTIEDTIGVVLGKDTANYNIRGELPSSPF